MPNETLLVVLTELSGKLLEKQTQSAACVEKWRVAVASLTEEVRDAEEEEACAIHDDEQVITKQSALRSYVNGLTEKPPYLLKEIESLDGIQTGTHRKRQEAGEITRKKRRELQEAKTRLAVAEKNHAALQKDWQDVSDRIKRLYDTG